MPDFTWTAVGIPGGELCKYPELDQDIPHIKIKGKLIHIKRYNMFLTGSVDWANRRDLSTKYHYVTE